MELPFEKTVCRYWKQKLYTLHTQEQTQELRLSDGMPDVGRVIASWGQVVLRGKEWRERGLGISGGVMVWVLYQPEGDGGLQRLETWIPFQARLDMPPSDVDGAIRVQSLLRSVDARITSSRKLMIRCGIGLLVQALVPAEAEVSLPTELPEDLEVLRRTYPVMLTVETGEKTFLIDEDLEIPGAVSPVGRMVYFQLEPELLDQKVMGSKAVFRGLGNLHILYWDQDEKLCAYDFQIPFAQYMDLDGEYEAEAQVANLFCVTSLELDVEEGGVLHLRCGMVSQYTIQDRSVLDLVEDAYSPCRDVELTRQALTLPVILDSRQQMMDLSQAIPGQEDTPVDRWFQPELPRVNQQGERCEICQEGSFGTLMEDRNGSVTQRDGKARGELEQTTHSGCDTIVFSWRKGGTGCRREGSDWRMDTQMVLDLSCIREQSLEMVTSMELGEERSPEPERPSVIIRAREPGEGLWDLAKRCGSTVGAISRMNKLEGEPEEDRLLLIPVL